MKTKMLMDDNSLNDPNFNESKLILKMNESET